MAGHLCHEVPTFAMFGIAYYTEAPLKHLSSSFDVAHSRQQNTTKTADEMSDDGE
jgi:hypothetical protein